MKKIFLISLLLATTNVFAQSAGVTLSVTNKVMAKMKRTERTLNRGSALYVGDGITTASNSLATLKYSNGTIVDLGERTNYQILAYSPKQSDITIKASLNSGKLHSKTSGRLKETLKTPVVALSILGTDYNVYVASQTKVYVRVNQGQVKARRKIIRAGESYVITPTRMYPAPFPKEGYVTSKGISLISGSGGSAGNGPTAGSVQGGGGSAVQGGSSTAQGGTSAAQSSASARAPVSATASRSTAVTQASNCPGPNCDDCRIDLVTRDNMDVVDTSLFVGASVNSIMGVVALIS
ncbi:MAG: hypothetical protein EPN84_04370 [Legionella sp.]|nr:MAG: hypothetical protein EPN84_04370 [Legionella sp.]